MHVFNRHRSLTVIAAAILLGSTSSLALAADISGGTATVNPGDPAQDWVLTNGATLNVNPGGETGGIKADASTVNINGGSVDYNVPVSGFSSAVNLDQASTANISDTTITSLLPNGAGLVATRGSIANVVNSTISGSSRGIFIRYEGVVDLSGSTVQGLDPDELFSAGAHMSGGALNATGGSIIRGARYGVDISADFRPRTGVAESTLTIDNSTVQGVTKSAIKVEVYFPDQLAVGHITVANGSSLLSGNGIALEVKGFSNSSGSWGATADFTVDNSAIEGDVVVDNLSTADVTLQNNASLKGQLSGVGNLALNSGGTWKMVADSGVTNLAMDGGVVEISDGSGNAFHTLTVGTLSGTGTFAVGTHLGVPEGDKLVVTEAGGANGDFMLHIKNSGADPKKNNALTVVETNGGDAKFAVQGGAVDLGTYKYYLNQVGNNWQLTGNRVGPEPVDPGDLTPSELSESAKTVISLDAAAANIWYAETGTLRQRLGDVRMGKGENGLWGRTYGRGINGNGAGGTDFDQSIWGLQAGGEHEVNLGGLPVILGVFGGYSNSTVDLDGGSKGEVDSGYGGLYATWLGNDGLYVDGLFKVNRFSNDARVVMSDGAGAQGDYRATGVGGQVEIGKTYELASGWYAEPFAQLAALRIGSFDYALDNGMTAHGNAYGSVQGRIGATFGRNLKLDNGGIFQPYVRVAVAQEFVDSNKLRINTVDFNNAFNGTRGEVGVGFAYQLRDALSVHADMDFSGGKAISSNWGGNIGVSYKF